MPYIKNAEPVTLNATCDHPVNNDCVEHKYEYPNVVIETQNVVICTKVDSAVKYLERFGGDVHPLSKILSLHRDYYYRNISKK